MAVSAEIATDKRRLIEFFLSPLLRMKDESLRER
jgi:hemolysin D